MSNFSLINVFKEEDGLVEGYWHQDVSGSTLEEAIERARRAESANGNRIKIAVVDSLGPGGPHHAYRRWLKRLD